MKRSFLLVLVLLLAACSTAELEQSAGDAAMAGTEDITVSNVRANLTLPSDTGSLWMEIHNGGDKDDALVGAEVPGCAVIELHTMVMENDVMVMRQVEGDKIPLPAGETVELKKGGLHVMCIGKEVPLEAGSTIDIVLQFENADDIALTAEVVEPGEMPMNMDNE